MANLQDIGELKRACAQSLAKASDSEDYKAWGVKVRDFLLEVRNADLSTLASEEFQRKIWYENPISGTGRGKIQVDDAIADPDFRTWLANVSQKQLPTSPEARRQALDALFNKLLEKVRRHKARTPYLMAYRVMAVLFPTDFTVLTDRRRLRGLHRAMFGSSVSKGPACHIKILRKLDEVIGPPSEGVAALSDRMRLPWLLFKDYVEPSEPGEGQTEIPATIPGEETLLPFTASRRRRGLTGVTGNFEALRSILDYCSEGVPREDLEGHVKTINPRLKDVSINAQLNVIVSELNCLKRDGDRYVLTDRGHAFLESGDPGDLMDWLVTHVLGIDHVLVILRDEGPCPKRDLISRIQQVNPGWTTIRSPTVNAMGEAYPLGTRSLGAD